MNEVTAHKKVFTCTKITELQNVGRFLLCKRICKLKNHVEKRVKVFEEIM